MANRGRVTPVCFCGGIRRRTPRLYLSVSDLRVGATHRVALLKNCALNLIHALASTHSAPSQGKARDCQEKSRPAQDREV